MYRNKISICDIHLNINDLMNNNMEYMLHVFHTWNEETSF